MKVYKPLEDVKNFKNLVFLAGPCPRVGQDWIDWRTEFIDKLNAAGFNGDIANPTNENYDENDPDYYNKQCTWETNAFHYASAIVFWIDRNDEHPALTTNIEFGIWSNKAPESLIVGIPENSEHCGYIKWVCEKKGIACYQTMDEVVNAVVEKFNNQPRLYFTSDTHFGADRTLQFSKRPFKDTNAMDLEIISRWNKTVTANDIVFHLGDFGNTDILNYLNFDKMFFLKGNYENEIEDYKIEDSRVDIFEDSLYVNIGGKNIRCVHEPISVDGSYEEFTLNGAPNFYLYGHIHEKGKVKRNGFNIGCDANNFTPVDVDTVKFYMNAILNYYDENVFVDKVM